MRHDALLRAGRNWTIAKRLAILVLLSGFVLLFLRLATDNSSAQTSSIAPPAASRTEPQARAAIADAYGKLELSFIPNKGQTDQQVKFLSHGPGYDLFLTRIEAVLTLHKPGALRPDKFTNPKTDQQGMASSVLRLQMLGANPRAQMEGREELPGKVNYFNGNQQDKWLVNVPTYRKVTYRDIYSGIDLVYYGNQRELEYDFVVQPGSNPSTIRFKVEGADGIRVDGNGDLVLRLKDGEVRLRKPFIYQITEQGGRDEIPGEYVIKGKEIGIKVRAYDSTKALVVDPVLSYSTLLGAGGSEDGYDIAVDSQGNAYITGVTNSNAFPTTPGAFQTSSTTGGAFVTKLNATGSDLVYSTYLSGNNGSTGTSIAVDSSGSAYVAGYTSSTNFPLVNPLKTKSSFFKTTNSAAQWSNTNTGLNSDVTALAVAASAPSTIYAGTSSGPYKSTDGGATWQKTPTAGLPGSFIVSSVAVDPTDSSIVYVGFLTGGLYKSINGGTTWSAVSLPLSFAVPFTIVFDPVTPSTIYVGSGNGVYKSTNSGSSWTQQNNFGLSGAPNVRALAIDPTTPATIYAGTFGSGFFKSTDAGASWIAINNGMSGSFSTYVGAIAIDPLNPSTVYAGHGYSQTGGAIDKTTNGGANWSPVNTGVPNFEVRSLIIDPVATSTVYAATTGGGVIKTTNGGTSWSIAQTGLWNANVMALVADPAAPTTLYAGTVSSSSELDAFVSQLNPTGSALLFSTYLGGSLSDQAFSIALDSTGMLYLGGSTSSKNFPTLNAIKSTLNSSDTCSDGFVTKLNPTGPSFVFSTYVGGDACDNAYGIAVDAAGNSYVTGSTTSSNFPTANAFQSTIGGSFNTDAFATKLSSGGALAYSTYLGGNGTDTGYGIAVDASGNAHITGLTTSTNFPTANPIQVTNGGSAGDAFVTKLNSAGSGLLYSTYLGGSNIDAGRGIAVDSAGNAYVTGYTGSQEFPLTPGSLRTKSSVYKSTDGAASWNNQTYGLGAASVVSLAINPQQPSTIYAGTRSGVFKSTNGGRTWSAINNGLNNLFVVQLVIDPITPSRLFAATTNLGGSSPNPGVYRSTDSGNSWTLVQTGMTNTSLLSLAIDPVTPTTLYAGTYGGPIYRTNNSGDNWAPSTNFTTGFAAWLAVDPNAPTNVYAADNASGGGIHKSVDGGVNWQVVRPGVSGTFVGVSPLTPGTVYASTNTGLLKSVDGGANWTVARTSSFVKVVFDPVSSSILYVLSTSEGVLKSTNGGQTFVPMNNGLRPAIASSMAINPLDTATLYVSGSGSGDNDAFVTKINPAGTGFVYSTLLGALPAAGDSLNLNDGASAIAIDSAGNAYVTGSSRSPDFPVTASAYQPFNRGFTDAFIAKLSTSYIISGQVLDGTSNPVGGVEVYLNDGTSLSKAVTESDGSYQFTNLREGGSFVVTASKPQFTMTPSSHTFNNLTSDQTANFTATATGAAFYTLSGQVTENGTALAGVSVTLSGSQVGVRTTDTSGNYSFTLAGGGNYTITPSKLAFTFAPVNQAFNNLSANQTADFAATRQNFVVTSANNHGAGSLRQAMLDAHATAGLDTIVFNIPGSSVKTISLLIGLPDITDPVVIDATTQPGYAGTPLIELNGAQAGSSASGFRVTSGGSTIRGFIINRFSGGSGIFLGTNGGNTIQGNYLGVDATGLLGRSNHTGVAISNSSTNLIGGTTTSARNVISGNGFDGVAVGGSNNQIQGNFIGTNAAGTAAIPNGINGVTISGSPSFTNNLVGGTGAGAGNLISGNQRGVHIFAPGNTVQGNLIGTDPTGTQAVANGTGVQAEGTNTLIGGTVPGARNVISGNTQGVYISGTGSKLQGNFIGTDITGTLALGNTGGGVFAGNQALIGGTVPEARNVISGNSGTGNVALGYNIVSGTVTVQGNFIGTDVTGNVALTNPTFGVLVSSSNHVIGGTVPEARNVISGHSVGIQIGGLTTASLTGNIVQGNLIGLNAAGDVPLQNLSGGIVLNDASNSTIGGPTPGAGNIIGFSGGAGVRVNSGTGNVIQSNSIFSNLGLGIDLSPEGVTPNDALDADTGANGLQNWPQLNSVSPSGGGTLIQGTLVSKPNTTFRIDFYANSACHRSGSGEGGRFFDTTTVTTDANGNATINFTSAITLAAGKALTATATDPSGNTSEFSPCDSTNAAGSLAFENYSYNVLEDVGTAVFNVVRTGGSKGTLSINYSSANGTATAGSDYTAVSGTLVFADGETTKSILLPVANDGATEPDETLRIVLTGHTDLETLGFSPVTTVTIQGNNTQLYIFSTNNLFDPPDPIDFPEGDSGTTNRTVFFRLSAQTSRTVTVDFNSQGVTATSGVDFGPVNGTLTFAPTVTKQTVTVPIIGDTLDESNETFAIGLSNAINGALGQSFATVRILDDDPLPVLTISDVSVTEGNSGTTTAVFNLTLSPASGRTVSVFLTTANGTATSGTDYVATSGSVSFTPGQTTKTFSVTVNGETAIEANETFVVNLSPISTATLARTQATGTIVDDDSLRLLLEFSGVDPNQAAAFDSLLFVRDPFRVLSVAEWWNLGADRNTRVLVFAVNLTLNPGESASDVTVSLVDSNSQTHNLVAEDVRAVPSSSLTQIRFRLPDALPSGNCMITLKAHGQTSNAGTFTIVP